MRRTLLCLLASLGLACFTSVTDANPLKVMSAPNLLRVGTAESIFVECQDCAGQPPMNVRISVWNHPTKTTELKHTTVTLNSGNKFQALAELVIPPDSFEKDPTAKQYVYLRAEFSGLILEKAVLVSFQSGFLFIQTDKTLYTPDSTVLFRIFALTPAMKPIGRDETTGNEATIDVEIVTPEGVVIPLDTKALKSAMYINSYKLGETVSVGQWKVVSRFQSNPQQKYSAEFEVKKYVLPSFEVQLTSAKPFHYYDDETFNVDIKATYLFGQEVRGMAFVVFGFMKDGIKKVFPASLQRISIINGLGKATLQKAHIIKTLATIARIVKIEELVGGSLFVTATVYTSSGSEMVEGELRDIEIVQSPYFINFDKTPKYFKSGLLFEVTVTVTNPDGTPAENIPVIATVERQSPEEGIQGTTRANGRAILQVNTRETDARLTITARTNNLPAHRQTSKSMVAEPHQSNSPNFLSINVRTADVTLGHDLNVNLNLNKQPQRVEITYLVLSRGQLVKFGRLISEGQVTIALNIRVTKKMLPSFRLITYYHPTPSEVVSDSVWVDVGDSCMSPLKLEHKKPRLSYEPRKNFNLRVTGEPGATVGLVAVDKGVYVLNKKHLLSQKKVWETVEKADTGCTPGGGQNSMGVFYDAGLLFLTDTAGGAPYRQDVKCPPPPARVRRSVALLDAITTLASRYNDTLERECCQDGMKKTLLSYSCAQRKLYITDGEACEEAFQFCCEELAKQRSELQDDNLVLARSEADNSFKESSDINARTQFPESWHWQTLKLPSCDGDSNCESSTKDELIPLKDSITTWVFTGISLSENSGICVGKPLDVVVFKQFFIDLRLPYSAVVGEQIEIRAILHNYVDDAETMRVELIENKDVCSSASKRGKFSQLVEIGPSTTLAVPFVIIPMEKGKLNIEVTAAVKDSPHYDKIIKPLLVVPMGVLTRAIKVLELNPSKNAGVQDEYVNITIPKADMVPNIKPSSRVFVTGRDQVGPLVENVIGTSSMGEMIYQPTGCGEQNMYHMTQTVIATTYLDKTKQWERVGLEKRNEALEHIKTGIQNEMKYAKLDGSFAVWTYEQSSVWLTAYVVKVFSMASPLTGVNNTDICKAVKFLIDKAQLPNGTFKETGPIYHREYTGDVLGADGDASLTAFCLIAMQESQSICTHTVKSLPVASNKSVTYLKERLPTLQNPYAVAITSYALANAGNLNKRILYSVVSPELNHWSSPRGTVFTLEATAYALLALVKGQHLEDAGHVVRWLTKQQKVGGGYGSTQATIMVYQAVAEYWTVAKKLNYNLNVELKVPARESPYHFQFTRDNHYATKKSDKFEVNENVRVIAKGTGEATLMLVTHYYAVPKEAVSNCAKFNLSVSFTADAADKDIYKLKMEFFFKNEKEDASMSILDITVPTGFTPMNEDLNALSEGRDKVISYWEYNKDLSEKGSIILYKNMVSHKRMEELTFRMKKEIDVGVLQPASVSIYEYYDETKCVKYYHPERKDGQILRRCKGNTCLCAEEKCSMQKKGNIDNRQRLAKACETSLANSIDFVYSVSLVNASFDQSLDVFGMRIEEVIKEGTYDKNAKGKIRRFLSFSHCRETLNLQPNKGYLIMGTEQDTLPDATTQSIEYLLGERTWIEYWPTGEECQEDEHKQTCSGLTHLVNKLGSDGCDAK